MIADGDSVARHAFRTALRDSAPGDTPLPLTALTGLARLTPNATQELDPCDILEVQDMAAAIARAEQLVIAPRRAATATASSRDSRDLFESLGVAAQVGERARVTDDTSGPALPASLASMNTPLPPPFPRSDRVGRSGPPRYLTMPSAPSNPEDDAYYQPAGRIRSLADVTLEGYRPEPTLLLRARGRRKRLSWVLVAVLLPLAVLAGFTLFGRADAAPSGVSTTTTMPAVMKAAPAAAPAVTIAPAPAPIVTAAPAPVVSPAPAHVKGAVPVIDVKNLPSAGARSRTR